MRIDVFSIFPKLIEAFAGESILGRTIDKGLLELNCHDIRVGANDNHQSVDDSPFGGGAGMVLKPEPIFETVEQVKPQRPIFLLSPTGSVFDQAKAIELSELGGFSLLCGRYEGVDQRVKDHLIDEELSVGNFILSGGEIAALLVIESVTRLLPGAMGNSESSKEESFSNGLLEYPHYTRPWNFQGYTPPEILRSGDHEQIRQWRKAMSLKVTLEKRPDLIAARGGLTEEEKNLIEKKWD
ncbi:MAG TPA: tRNA (guanosine(37)-N1)-methyltransferase TrmD [Acidimicrobiales bacterium]|nr:tRNA (guanosine(37)-N1)-methyltransferase TrmD [Acidimicrobiales bacterium]